MKTATISQTKNHLSALIDQVKQGETILILDRDKPVARLEPVAKSSQGFDEARIARLERAGLVRRGTGRVPREILEKRPPRVGRKGDILKALLAERREGR